jgi:hypothetical protein
MAPGTDNTSRQAHSTIGKTPLTSADERNERKRMVFLLWEKVPEAKLMPISSALLPHDIF